MPGLESAPTLGFGPASTFGIGSAMMSGIGSATMSGILSDWRAQAHSGEWHRTIDTPGCGQNLAEWPTPQAEGRRALRGGADPV